MIIKNADSKEHELAALEGLLAKADPRRQKLISDQIRRIRAGIKGEQESAYLLDFALGQSKNTAIVHDLRLELSGRVAQIDHLVIHSTHRFYVLETKSFAHGLKITEEGEFLRWNGWTKNYEGMPSPVEQNRRHAMVLREMLERLGYKDPKIECFVLVSPHARISRPAGKQVPEVVKADQFLTAYQKNLDASLNSVTGFISGVSKAILGERPEILAQKLVQMHRPSKIDFAGKFGIEADAPLATPASAVSQPTGIASDARRPELNVGWRRSAEQTKIPSPEKIVAHCKNCAGSDLSVAYGKFGYFLKCSSCDGNTAIKIGCGVDGHKERIRKDGLTFYRECAACGTSSVFFENKAARA